MPHSAASAHIEQVVGEGLVAAEDLRLRILSGDVEAQQRRVTPGAGIEIIPLTPESFKVSDALSDDLGPFSRSFPLEGHNIFLRRADVTIGCRIARHLRTSNKSSVTGYWLRRI
jgi:hypothetical protein